MVELLVVIAIIISLGAIGSIVYRSAYGALANTKAQQGCSDLVMAIENFQNDHNGLLPIEDYPEGDQDMAITTEETNPANLIAILTNRESGTIRVNKTGRTYLGGEPTDDPAKGGIYSRANTVGFYDPWGSPYIVVLDANMDDKVKNPLEPASEPVYKKVIAISTGADKTYGDADTNEDNVYSYKAKK